MPGKILSRVLFLDLLVLGMSLAPFAVLLEFNLAGDELTVFA